MAVFLNTFRPLVMNRKGRLASEKFNLPKFIDGSCRREPDFENMYPAITQLCRPKKLVKRLNDGDLIIYLTKLGKHSTANYGWHYVGILEVIKTGIFPNHLSASEFYKKMNLPISQNIFCNETSPFPLKMTNEVSRIDFKGESPEKRIKIWNAAYRKRSNKYPEVAITKVWNEQLFLNNPAVLTHEKMNNIFGRVPGTQNPPKLTNEEWGNFRNEMSI